jgi:hypothetical protein
MKTMIKKLKGYLHRKWFDKNYEDKFSKVKVELDIYYAMELATILMSIDEKKLHTDYQYSIKHFIAQLAKSITEEQIEDVHGKNALNELIRDVNSSAN